MMIRLLMASAVVALLGTTPAFATSVSPTPSASSTPTTYSFTGTCAANDPCTTQGTGTGLGTLIASDSVTTISSANFTSFSYSSGYLSFFVNSSNLAYVGGTLTNLPGQDDFTLDFYNANDGDREWQFQSTGPFDGGGAWSVGRINFNVSDMGPTSLWGVVGTPSAVPEPATWAMVIAGIALMGGAMRYRRRARRVAFG